MEEIKKKLKARVGHLKDEGALNHARELTALLEYVGDLEDEIAREDDNDYYPRMGI